MMINYVTLFRRTEKKGKYYSLVPLHTIFVLIQNTPNKQNCHLKLTQILYVKKALGKGGDKGSISSTFYVQLLRS